LTLFNKDNKTGDKKNLYVHEAKMTPTIDPRHNRPIYHKCHVCGRNFETYKADPQNCPLCSEPANFQKRFKVTITVPKGMTLWGLAVEGKLVETRFAIINGSLEESNKTSGTWNVYLAKANIVLEPERKWKTK